MNKLKKILILLPILATTLFIKEVKAEERYINSERPKPSYSFQVSYKTTLNDNYTIKNNYTFYGNKINFAYQATFNTINRYVFKNKDYNVYAIFLFDIGSGQDIYFNSSSNKIVVGGSYNSDFLLLYFYEDINEYNNFISDFSTTPTLFGTLNLDNNSSLGSVKYFTYNFSGSNTFPVNSFKEKFCLVFSDTSVYFDDELIESTTCEPELEPEPEPTPQENYNKLYVPNYNENMCVEVIDKDTIRVFDSSESLNYTDYYVNSHYLEKKGQVDSEYVKNCTSLEKSSSFIYRNDISEILFVALLACVFTYLSMYLLFRVFRKRSR